MPPAPRAVWPNLLIDRCAALRAAAPSPAREAVRGQTWVLLHDALMRFLRAYARGAPISREDLEDIAATKALELLLRAESGSWDSLDRSTGEVVGYIARVAHNGLVDFVRRAQREVHIEDTLGEDGATALAMPPHGAPESRAEAREFTRALRACVERLQPRARRVWFFRAFHEMTSREIAAHPDVGIKASHVDVMVQRAREALRECMRASGLDASDAPAGAFVALWAELESMRDAGLTAPEPGASG